MTEPHTLTLLAVVHSLIAFETGPAALLSLKILGSAVSIARAGEGLYDLRLAPLSRGGQQCCCKTYRVL